MKKYVIGFDVGGTRLKSGAVSPGGRMAARGTVPSGFAMGPKSLVKLVAGEVERIAAKNSAAPQAVGLAFPGAVQPDLGVVFLPGKLKGLQGYPIVPELEQKLGLPVVADNDGRISMLAEATYGQARQHDWALTLTLGTGVGSGVKLDGRVLRDPHLQFGTQMSHIVMRAGAGRLCITGARDTAEMSCSATALAMAVREGLARGILSELSDLYFRDPHAVDFKAVIGAVEKGDRLCTDELRVWTENLGWLLVSAVHVYAPQVIILSGGATNAAVHFMEPLQRQVNEHIFRYPVDEGVPIVLSKLRDHAGVLGSAAVAWERAAKETDQ
ncbi:MAG: ROK family protein [Candidatus Latescibacteria bacterium]|nr:ROK family protein [Candidatus Latescibacterota bacterium]